MYKILREAGLVKMAGDIKSPEMVTCEGIHGAEHAPVAFYGVFAALCPLCATLEKAADLAEELAESSVEATRN